jgi:hypothetical protein
MRTGEPESQNASSVPSKHAARVIAAASAIIRRLFPQAVHSKPCWRLMQACSAASSSQASTSAGHSTSRATSERDPHAGQASSGAWSGAAAFMT